MIRILFGMALAIHFSGGQRINEEMLPCSTHFNSSDNPCLCSSDSDGVLSINCDQFLLKDEVTWNTINLQIADFSQRRVGYKSLSTNLFIFNLIGVRKLDFSENHIFRIADNIFVKLNDTLEELLLGHNALGDHLNPLFSTNEFNSLTNLQTLDLSYNQIKELDDNVFKELAKLQELNLEGNMFEIIPRSSLRPLKSLQELYLQDNLIPELRVSSFTSLYQLTLLNLSGNGIAKIQPGSFAGLDQLQHLLLASNQIGHIQRGTFNGLKRLSLLDLSDNSLSTIPWEELGSLSALRILFLGSNRIRALHPQAFENLTNLEFLELSRNRIFNVPSNVFASLQSLREMHLDINLFRKWDENMFNNLVNIEVLTLDDNMLLNVPTQALAKLPNLRVISMNYNRISVLSINDLQKLHTLEELSLQYNMIREILPGTFSKSKDLQMLDLHGNFVSRLSGDMVNNLEHLIHLDVGDNKLLEVTELSLPFLETLILDRNKLTIIPDDALRALPELLNLELSFNFLTKLPSKLVLFSLRKLKYLHLQHNEISQIPVEYFDNFASLMNLNLSYNHLSEIAEKTFYNLPQTVVIDLSHNQITNISDGAFHFLAKLKYLNLSHNKLTTFRDNHYRSLSVLEILDLSHNDIFYIYPTALSIHLDLRYLDLSHNKLLTFAPEIIYGLHHLYYVNLNNNNIQFVGDGDFSNLPNLQILDLSNNSIHTLAETVFQNSSQLQFVNLSWNNLKVLYSKVFSGLMRLNLDLSHNSLQSLPEDVFHHQKVARLESINLAFNQFAEVPLSALQVQYFYLKNLDMNNNRINWIPSNANTLINVKQLDLSGNQLSPEIVNMIFTEPKTVRELTLSSLKISTIPPLETPFLQKLNLSYNMIKELSPLVFQRVSNLISLDLSHNLITNISSGLSSSFQQLQKLKSLDLSNNPITQLNAEDFAHLSHLRSLKLNNLPELMRFEEETFQDLHQLQHLEITNFPRIPFLNIKNVLQGLSLLKTLFIEIKHPDLHDQLYEIFSSRLTKIGIYGKAFKNIATHAFAGMTNPEISINLINTSLDSLSSSMFVSLPMSSRIKLSLPNNKIESLALPFLNFLEEHKGHVKIQKLSENPLNCDCSMLPLKQWSTAVGHDYIDINSLSCSSPNYMKNKMINALNETDFSCIMLTSVEPTTFEKIIDEENFITPFVSEVITGNPPAVSVSLPEANENRHRTGLNNMDSMIIGIIVGVVAFVCIIIIIICVVKLRQVQRQQKNWSTINMNPNHCTCLKSEPPEPHLCHCAPSYPPQLLNQKNTSKMFTPVQTISRNGYYTQNPPYYVTYPESDQLR